MRIHVSWKIITGIVFILLFFSGCNLVINDSGSGSGSFGTGAITGKALFENSDDHSGIIVSLEKTEAGMTRSVSAAIADSKAIESRVLDDQTSTSSDGSYAFSDVAPGTYTIYASSADSSEKAVYTTVTVNRIKSVTAPDLQLTAVGSIAGQVVLDGSTTGNIGYFVFIAGTSFLAITDDSGYFTISGVPSGEEYSLTILYGTDTYSWESVAVNPRDTVDVGRIDLTDEDLPGRISIVWRGESATEPNNPLLNWVYYNTTDGISYIYNGTDWDILAQDGADGTDGDDGAAGVDGISITWKGELASAPSEPELNWAYYNTTDGISYYENKIRLDFS